MVKKSLPYGVIICLVLLLVYKCDENKQNLDGYTNNIDALTDSVMHYKNVIGTHTASIKTLQIEKKQLKKLVLKKDSLLNALSNTFSSVKSVTKYKTITKIDTVYITHGNITDSLPYFKLQGSSSNKWLSMEYTVTPDSLIIAPLSVYTETAVITGYKRKWFLGKESLVTEVTHTNPYITTTGIKSAEVILPSPWYKKWYVWLAAGLAGGLLIK